MDMKEAECDGNDALIEIKIIIMQLKRARGSEND